MKVLIIGGGGREHAVASKLAESPLVDKLYAAPGNGGIAKLAQCVDIKATDVAAMVDFARREGIDFVCVTPDDPLAAGMVDAMEAVGIAAFGPSQAAAQIEASKVFCKDLMQKYHIPTAEYAVFSEAEPARAYIREKGAPIVIKADGLALGKGGFCGLHPGGGAGGSGRHHGGGALWRQLVHRCWWRSAYRVLRYP